MEHIRPVTATDIPALKTVVDSSALFPSEYLEDMMANYLNEAQSEEIWFTCTVNHTPVAVGYCIPEKFTAGTYNLLALGVSPDFQGKGIAGRMMAYIEQMLRDQSERILLIETSSDDAQSAARHFYHKMGYTQVAAIPDFWDEGEDKLIFLKKLQAANSHT